MDKLSKGLSWADLHKAPVRAKTGLWALLVVVLGLFIYFLVSFTVIIIEAYRLMSFSEVTRWVEIIDVDDLSVEDTIRYIAEREGFDDADYLVALATCESSLRAGVTGAQGEQGAFQIHPYFHPNVNGYDLEEATVFTINQLKKGNARLWACASKI